MSVRLNLLGFSLPQMRSLFGSRDERALARMQDQLRGDPHLAPRDFEATSRIVERAVMTGVPFDDLVTETHAHYRAASLLAEDQQEMLPTMASTYDATALSDGLWRGYGKYAGPEIRALLRGLVEGVPLFGRRFPPIEDGCMVYAAIGRQKLLRFRPGLADLREQVSYRAGEDDEATEFVTEFGRWIDEITEAGLDLWYCTG